MSNILGIRETKDCLNSFKEWDFAVGKKSH